MWNRTRGGYQRRYADRGAGQVRWSVPLDALSDDEANAIGALFEAAEGRLRTFLFLDPAANLITWSEDFSRRVWAADPLIQQATEIRDPMGTMRATRFVNGAQTPQRLTQTLAVPASFVYCLSIYARSVGGAAVKLVRSAAGVEKTATTVLDTEWRRITSSGVLGGVAQAVTFGVELQPGTMLELFGMQVEAQIAPSEYIATRGVSGIYPAARFDVDELLITAQSAGRSDAVLKIVSKDGD